MAAQTQLATEPKSGAVVEQKIQKLRELYDDAPELGRAALEKGLPDLKRELAAATGTQNAGRIGARQGKVSELNIEGWPGIHSPSVKDFIANHQIAAEAWYVASPNLTVAETRRLERVGQAVEEFLDQIG
jgi:hypothetical protein